MNQVILMGRLTRDPDIRYSNGENVLAIARFNLAVNRKFKNNEADFIRCIAFGKNGEFAEKYLRQGSKIVIAGRIQTGSYTNRDGQKVYTTDVVIEEFDFAESKKSTQQGNSMPSGAPNPANASSMPSGMSNQAAGNRTDSTNDGFMNIPDGIEDELPFR